MEHLKSPTIRVPQGGDKVFKDECVHCFDSPVSTSEVSSCLVVVRQFVCEVHLQGGMFCG